MKDAVKAIKCENVANFTSGFEYAFEILHRVRVSLLLFFLNFVPSNEFFYFVCSTTNRVKEVNAIKQ